LLNTAHLMYKNFNPGNSFSLDFNIITNYFCASSMFEPSPL
jgi:hypothetical protein